MRRPVRIALKVAVLVLVAVVFVRPLVSNFRKALADLSDVHVVLLLVGVGLQGLALLAYTSVVRTALARPESSSRSGACCGS